MIYLIVPCYNEAQRLNVFEFAKYPQIHFLFADDGSKDNTSEILQKASQDYPNMHFYKAPQNMGKGEVIRNAYQHLKKQSDFEKIEWIGFWDADLATPIYEVENMLKYASFYGESSVRSIWGSRLYRLGSRIVRSPIRHYLGRGFATVVAYLLKVESYDSQCGAKLFNREAAELAFREPFISRWIFDVEILLRLQQKGVIEYPLREWCDIPGSKMKIGREILRVFKDILKIRDQYILKK